MSRYEDLGGPELQRHYDISSAAVTARIGPLCRVIVACEQPVPEDPAELRYLAVRDLVAIRWPDDQTNLVPLI